VTVPPIRVVRIIARMNIGGPARHVALLESHMPALGYASWLVHGSPAAEEGELPLAPGPGHEIVRVGALSRAVRPGQDLAAFREIWRVLRRVEPDVVDTHTAKAGALGRVAASVYNFRRPRQRRAIVIHTFHGSVFRGYFGAIGSAIVRNVERALARLTDRIIAISRRQRDELVDVFRIAPAERVVVIPLGLDLDALAAIAPPVRAGSSDPVRPVTCAFVGRLVAIKQVDLLLRACARAFTEDPRGRLLVAGDGESRAELEALAARLGLGDRVRFVGWQTDLAALYAGIDVVALSSINEGTPVTVIEAMAAGRAVVSTAVGGVPDLIDDGRTGRLVPPGDEVALARALTELIADADLRARLGAAARADVVARFGYARLVADMDRLYRETLASTREGRAR
jgi:glycosyltransferase involved in cell wall biosynthesis